MLGGLNTFSYALNNPIGLYDPYGLWAPPSLPEWLVDGAAGFGDTLSFGTSEWIRERAGIDGGVNECSQAYSVGEFAGLGLGVAIGGGAAAHGAKAIARAAGPGARTGFDMVRVTVVRSIDPLPRLFVGEHLQQRVANI